jgi:hypothetical protein
MSEQDLRQLPNIGPAIARKLIRIGIEQPADLQSRDPSALFDQMCALEGRPLDPCLLDTLVAVVDHANGAPARPWWHYSRQRLANASPARTQRRARPAR